MSFGGCFVVVLIALLAIATIAIIPEVWFFGMLLILLALALTIFFYVPLRLGAGLIGLVLKHPITAVIIVALLVTLYLIGRSTL